MNRSWIFVTFVPLSSVGFILYHFGSLPWTPVRVVGLILSLLAFSLLTVARVHLGSSFSLTPQARQLVTQGIYSRIRHPVYLFSTLGLAGLALYVQMPLLLATLAIVIPVQVMRARAEERVLEDRFGDAYRAWRATTWF